MLTVKRKVFESDWVGIINGIVLVPSADFSKLIIETGDFDQTQIEQLTNSLKLMKQKIDVEIRCDLFQMHPNSQFMYGFIEGYYRIYQRVKTHHIFVYKSDTTTTRIDLYSKKVTNQALNI